MEKIKFYTKDDCRQCKMSIMVLKGMNFDMDKIDFIYVDKDEKALRMVKEVMGFRGVPVIDAPGFEAFQGFRPDKLREIAASF